MPTLALTPLIPGSLVAIPESVDGLQADYIVYTSASGSVAASYVPGFQSYFNSDPAAAFQSALTALGTKGGTIVLAGPLAWGSVPAIPPGITGKLRIVGTGRATITLSSAGPRFLDFGKTADYDTFKNIEIRDLQIDVNNVGGRNHVVIGTYAAGVQMTRINILNLLVDNVRTFNVPVDSTTTNHRLNIWIVPDMPASSAVCTLRNISVSRVKFEGGNMGVVIGGTGSAATSLTIYDTHIDQWWHSLLAVQSGTFFSSSNCQVGSLANVDRCIVSNGYGQYSGDVGVEIDSAQWSLVENVTIEDPITAGFYHTNFNAPPNPNEQMNRYRDCRARKLTQTGTCDGYVTKQNNSVALNNAQYIDCDWYCNETTTATGSGFAAATAAQLLELVNCRFVREGFVGSATSITNISLATQASTTTRLILEGVESIINGTISGSPAGKLTCLKVDGASSSSVIDVKVDRCLFQIAAANSVNNTNILVWFSPSVGGTYRGHLRSCRFSNTVDGGYDGILFGGGTVAITTDPFKIENNDFSGFAAALREVIVSDTTQKPKIRLRSNVWKTKPVPVAFTGLTTATGKTLDTLWDALAVFAQGSGAAVTAVDFSTNGGTTYTNFLTQASAALPAGFSQIIGPLTSDALIKATFTTTQPTITLVPVNP